jgi:hypothetical protein
MAGYAIMPERKNAGKGAAARADRVVRTRPRRSGSEMRGARGKKQRQRCADRARTATSDTSSTRAR